MLKLQKPDFGLEDLVGKYSCGVTEERVKGLDCQELVKLTLTSLHPKWQENDYNTVTVLASPEGRILGARQIWESNVYAGLLFGEGILGYRAQEMGPTRKFPKKFAVGLNLDLQLEPNEMYSNDDQLFSELVWASYGISVTYGHQQNGTFSPEEVLLRDKDDSLTGANMDRLQSEDNHLLSVVVNAQGSMVKLRFPETLTQHQVLEMMRILKTETEWLELPKRCPILHYTRAL